MKEQELAELEAPTNTEVGWKDDPTEFRDFRWWDGTSWTLRVGRKPKLIPLTPDERKRDLAKQIEIAVTQKGCRVESQSDFQAIVVKGKNVNHVLHLILTIFTLGLWLFVWVGVWGFSGEQRTVLNAAEDREEE